MNRNHVTGQATVVVNNHFTSHWKSMALVESLQPTFALEADCSVAPIRLYYPRNIAVTNVKVTVSEEGSGNNLAILNFHPISLLYLAFCQGLYSCIPQYPSTKCHAEGISNIQSKYTYFRRYVKTIIYMYICIVQVQFLNQFTLLKNLPYCSIIF